jgi:hypothetical protein
MSQSGRSATRYSAAATGILDRRQLQERSSPAPAARRFDLPGELLVFLRLIVALAELA